MIDYRARALNQRARELIASNSLGEARNLCVAGLITTIAQKRKPHVVDGDYAVVHGFEIRKTGVPIETIAEIAPIEFLPHKPGHYARGAKLLEGTYMPLVAASDGQVDLHTGKCRRKPRAPIASRDVNGANTTYQNHGIQSDPWVNRDALRALIADQASPPSLRAQAAEVISSCEIDGRRFTQYVESRSGRLYPQHAVPLSREIRRAAFNYGYEVDIRNAHFTFMGAKARELGINAPLLSDYVLNPAALRLEVAELLGVGPSTAKQVLLMLVYGAPLDDRNSIAKAVKSGGGDTESIRQCKPLKQLKKELSETGRAMIDAQPLSRNKQFLLNDLGKGIAVRATKAQKLAHLNQGTEAMVAKAAAEGEEIISWEHDGWTQEGIPDLECLAAKAKKRTGIDVEFTLKGDEDDFDLSAFLEETTGRGILSN